MRGHTLSLGQHWLADSGKGVCAALERGAVAVVPSELMPLTAPPLAALTPPPCTCIHSWFPPEMLFPAFHVITPLFFTHTATLFVGPVMQASHLHSQRPSHTQRKGKGERRAQLRVYGEELASLDGNAGLGKAGVCLEEGERDMLRLGSQVQSQSNSLPFPLLLAACR